MNELTLFKNTDSMMPALNDYVDPMAGLSLPSGVANPRISIKNGRFTIVKDGDETTLDSLSLHAVIIGVNPTDHRSWYLKAWSKDAEPVSPDCWSANDVNPDPSCAAPQSDTCATCPHNAWGSSRKDNSGGKDCSAHRRIVVLAQGDEEGDQYIMNLPATSIKEFGTYRKILLKKNAAFQRVVTKISFDPNAVGKLMFDAVEWVPADIFLNVVAPRVMDESVLDALEVSFQSSVKTETAPATAAPKAAKAKVATPAAVAEAEAPVVEADIPPPPAKAKGFGAAAKPAATKAAPKPEVQPAVASGGLADLENELDKMLAGGVDA